MYRIWLSLLGLAAFAVPAAAEQLVDDSAIQSLLVGKSATFADRSIATYGEDGTYTYVASNNLYFTGKYAIAKGKVCLTMKQAESPCYAVGTDPYGAYLVTGAGNTLRFSVSAPVQMQHVTTLCDVPVAYNVYPPANYVPREAVAFSGTWVGKWDYGMCGALIVESIQPNGVASVIYINGDFRLERTFKPGSIRFLAAINDNVLSDGGRSVSFEATMKEKDTLTVRKIGGPGAGTARFTRQK